MAWPYDEDTPGASGSVSQVPTGEWFGVNTATGEWQRPGQPTLARSAGMPDITASPVWGGTPDEAPLAIGQVAGTLAPPMTIPASMQRLALADRAGLLPEQPTMWGTIARALAMASPAGKSILTSFDQQQQQGLQNRLALRRQHVLEDQETRQATQTSLETLRKISEMPSKTMRNLMFERYVTEMSSSGQPLPADMVEAFKKSSLDDGKQMAAMLTPMFEAAGIDPTTAQQLLQEGGDPKRLMEMIDLGLKTKKATREQDEAATLQRIQAGGTLGDVSGVQAEAPAPTTGTPAQATPTTPAPTARAGTVPPVLDTAVTEATRLYPQVRPDLVHGIIRHESNYDAGAVSPKGATGVMQLMPGTAKDMGVDPKDPVQNVRGGTRYVAQLLTKYHGNEALALAAYNWGPGNVDKVHGDLTKMPAETQAYVKNVLATAAGGQRGPAGTQGQVAGPGAPTPTTPAPSAADSAALTRLKSAIAQKQQQIQQLSGLSSDRANKVADNMRADLKILQEQYNRLEDRLTETPRAVAKDRALYEEKGRQQAQPMLPEDRRKLLTGLRSDIRQEPTFKIYQDVRNGYQNVQIGARRDSSEGDLALIYGLAKILDPGSVVRESEFATVAAAQGKLQQLLNTPQRFFEGDRLTPENRKKLLDMATALSQAKLLTAQQELRSVYAPLAKEGNIPFEQLLPLGDLKSHEGQSLLEDMNRAR